MTKEITEQAQKQYLMGNDMEQNVVAKFFTPWTCWTWYVMNQDPEDPDYLWGIVQGLDLEIGSFSLSELEGIDGPHGLKVERDRYFKPMVARELYRKLERGEYV